MNNIPNFLKGFKSSNMKTLPCFGPMSKNTIGVCSEIAQEYEVPIVLIASRRQIDSIENGCGYVENFDTNKFVQSVRSTNQDYLFIARDHGGPCQGNKEVLENMNVAEAMQSSIFSFKEDIRSGFDLIHIDPSIPIQGEDLTQELIIQRLLELWAECEEYSKSIGVEVNYEFGTEEQSGYSTDLGLLKDFLDQVMDYGIKNKLKLPTYIVAQTGTKVLEMQNIGVFASNINELDKEFVEHIIETSKLVHSYGFLIKEHNADYLSDQSLIIRPHLGIDASNIAPEFGVVETKTLMALLKYFGLEKNLEEFVSIAIDSNKWDKWMIDNSQASEIDKAYICGHYIFSNEAVISIKNRLKQKMKKANLDLNQVLMSPIKSAIIRYLNLLNIIR